ncbi:MAG TPA: tetratricopeptide repeat protein [Pyrinomonadaceae bacterium]|nr:tetratricopeptide repeat protein [Pyrinomonadaceae bacterium]
MKLYLKIITLFIFVLSGLNYNQAQTNSGVTSEQRQEANTFFQNQDWENSAKAYEKIVKAEGNNIGAKTRLATALLNLNKLDEARTNFEMIVDSAQNPTVALSLARIYGRQNEKEKVFSALEKMIKFGGVQPEILKGEKDFALWQNEEKFIDLVKRSDFAVNPCKASPDFRQFDFWIGEWVAKTPNGAIGGTSSIQLILNSCVIFENWTSMGGTSGKSFNIYDVTDKKWHQTWMDAAGTFTHYIGEFKDGKMVLIGDGIISGQKALLKMTFTPLPNGEVRQFGENSVDNGKTWTIAFDFIYSKKK